MTLANFFERTATSVSSVLQGADPTWLRNKLKKLNVCIAFDDTAATSSEGNVALDLATDLFARFYPSINFIELEKTERTVAVTARLKALAKAIHPRIDFSVKETKLCGCLVVGRSRPTLEVPTIFVGSNGWTASVRYEGPSSSANTDNPFGASAAACLGVAGLFRMIFADELQISTTERPFDFDVLHHKNTASSAEAMLPKRIDLGRSHLVGLGAIGRATCWTLARVDGLCGELHGVDGEKIELSNLQRYLGATQSDAQKGGRKKTTSVARMFAETKSVDFRFIEHPLTWGDYLRARGDFGLSRVAVALDTAKDRIAVQASLPRRLFNAWTQPGDLGVSRHVDFANGPCLACLYWPKGEVKSLSVLVSESLCLPEPEIRTLLHINFRVDANFLRRVSEAANVPLDELFPFINEPIRSFYSKAVCGTTHFKADRIGIRGETAVPMAFQSALAGVLLAAEIVADVTSLRTLPMAPITNLNLLAPIGSHFHTPAAKLPTGQCICQDEIYQRAYRMKFSCC